MPAQNSFQHYAAGTSSPALDTFNIVPDAVNELPYVVRDIRMGATAGTVVWVTTKGTETTMEADAYASLGPFFVKQVKSGPAGMVGYI